MPYGTRKVWQSFREVLEPKSSSKGVLCPPEQDVSRRRLVGVVALAQMQGRAPGAAAWASEECVPVGGGPPGA